MLFDPEETYLWGLKSRTSVFILSVVSVATFVVDLAFQVCGILLQGRFSNIGSGIWCGVVFGATGAYGLYLLQRGSSEKKVSFLSMVGFGIPFALILVGLSGYAVSAVYQCDSSYINLTCEGKQLLWIVSNAILIVSGVTSFVTSLLLTIITDLSLKTTGKGLLTIPIGRYKSTYLEENPENWSQSDCPENGDRKSESSSSFNPDSGFNTSIDSNLSEEVKQKSCQASTEDEFIIHGNDRTEMDPAGLPSTTLPRNWRSLSVDTVDSDDNTNSSKTIKLSKEDFIVHVPSPSHCNCSSIPD